MTTDRIKEIQQATAYPESHSVQLALLQVWNECSQESATLQVELEKAKELLREAKEDLTNLIVAGYEDQGMSTRQAEIECNKKYIIHGITTFLSEGTK